MAGSLNKVTLIGNLGADPEVRNLNGGNSVANFSLATSESWKDKATGEKKEVTQWHRVVVWNDGLIGVIEKYVKKGSKIYIEGELQTRKYEKDGVERYTTEVVLTGFGGKLVMLDSAGGGNRDQNENTSRPGNKAGEDYGSRRGGSTQNSARDLDDEIPF